MFFQIKSPHVVCAAGLVFLAWYVQSPSLTSDPAASVGPTSSSYAEPQARSFTSVSHNVATAFPSASVAEDRSVKVDQKNTTGSRQQITQLLGDYSSGVISLEDKKQIQSKLQSIILDPVGRSNIVEMFSDAQNPQQATAVYGLIRDADVKDSALIEELIQRDSGSGVQLSKRLLVDLIADLGTRYDAPYSPTIDQYVSQLVQGADSEIRASATAQKIWYESRYQPDRISSLAPYLQDTASQIREEMYGMIESHLANRTLQGSKEFAMAIEAAMRDDRLNMSPDEQARATTLLANLR